MKLIIGLGNPGPQYANTRHNAGFLCVDRIAELQGWRFNQKRAQSQVAEGEIKFVRVVLAKPQTFMNNSGLAAARLMQSFHVSPADMLVIYDDVDLTAGVIRMRERGSAGTHNGMRSIIQECRTSDFPRLRIGIAEPDRDGRLRDFVLDAPIGEEAEFLKQGIERAAEAAIAWVKEGATVTMNRFNG
jgi:peptidyl-tRNA hydrolase, PTH1 family